MFTSITHPEYSKASHGEYLWQVSGDFTGFLAGALLGSEIVRVRLLRGAHLPEVRYQLADGGDGTLPYHSWTVVKGDEQWPSFASEQEAQAILAPYLHGFAVSDTHLRLARPLTDTERIYGLGERTGEMNKRGQSFSMWNTDPARRYDATLADLYTSIPFYIGLHVDTGRSYGVFVDYMGRVEMDMGQTDPSSATITIEDDQLVVYFFVGPTIADVLRQYSELTGCMPLPARWTLGHHQSRWSYMSEEQVLDVARKLRAGNHPCDSIWLDIDYMDGYRIFTWNRKTFPHPERMIQQLHEQGLRLVTIIDPGVKIDENYFVYQQIKERDYFCRLADGTPFVGSVWPGHCLFPDFSRREVRTWWGNLYQTLLDQGVDATWNDMNEPALTNFLTKTDDEELENTTMSDDVLHRAGGEQPTGQDGPPQLHRTFHNAYGMEMARASYQGLLRLRPDSRPFVLSRAGSAGLQRYAALWTGDNTSTWEHILLAIRMCLDMGVSGVPFVGADIGGFWDDSDGELLVRFAQMGALLPFSRNHNSKGYHDQEPWSFGEPYESAYRRAIETRYRLLPYLYTLCRQAATDGAPIMRPLYYHYPQDEQACDTTTQFMVGDSLLSAPIAYPGSISRDVYLPAGSWFDYWNGQEYPGSGTTTIDAPLDRWPLFVRGNSILPSAPVMQYADQLPSAPLTFTCYMSSDGLATYTLYEDDGNSQAYRSGAFAETSISCRVENDGVTIRIDEHHERYRPERTAYEIVAHVGNRVQRRSVPVGQGSIVLRFDI